MCPSLLPAPGGCCGEIALIGVLAREGDTSLHELMFKGAWIRGIFVGSQAMAANLNSLVAAHGIKRVIDRSFAFADTLAALRYQAPRIVRQGGNHPVAPGERPESLHHGTFAEPANAARALQSP